MSYLAWTTPARARENKKPMSPDRLGPRWDRIAVVGVCLAFWALLAVLVL